MAVELTVGIPTHNRRETVLLKMFQQHYISLAQYQYWKVSQLYPANGPPLQPGAPETAFYPSEQQQTQYPYFVDYLRRYLEQYPGIGPDKLYRGGLRIQTTLEVRELLPPAGGRRSPFAAPSSSAWDSILSSPRSFASSPTHLRSPTEASARR